MGDFRSQGRGGFGGRGGGRDRGSFGGERGGFGGGRRSFGGDRGRGPVEMHDAVCDKCKKNCQVPFRPTGDKPVYCSDCFSKNEGGSSSRDRGNGSSAGISAEQFGKLNAKLDKIIHILEELEIVSDEEELDEITDDAEDEDSEDEVVVTSKESVIEDEDFDEDEDSEDDSEAK